jgi:5'-3' exonuclease
MRLHLVDGTYELFRAYYSKRPPHVAPDGSDKKATVALASAMLALLHDDGEAVTHVAVAFDNPIRSFRNDLFDGYKTEEGVPPELLAQFDPAEEAMRALGMAVWSMREFEADDALATGAARYGAQVEQVRILTPDKDLGQCLRGARVVQVDRMRGKVVDEPALRALRGIAPESIPDWLALVGDTADGIPGLQGFGEKGAAAVLAAFLHLEQIPADPRTWPESVRSRDTLARTLAEHREDALLYRTLATLRTDAPVDSSLSALEHRGIPREPFELFARQVDAPGLLSRVTRWAA